MNGAVFFVVGRDKLLDFGDQLFDTEEAATSNRSLRDDSKPAFHLIWPPADFVYSHEAYVTFGDSGFSGEGAGAPLGAAIAGLLLRRRLRLFVPRVKRYL